MNTRYCDPLWTLIVIYCSIMARVKTSIGKKMTIMRDRYCEGLNLGVSK